MSMSIYYKATRSYPLSAGERAAVSAIIDRFSVDREIQEYFASGEGLNWESFSLYDTPSAPDVVLEGATKLPDITEEAVWTGVQHWCAALSEVRRVISDAIWQVAVEEHEIMWDEVTQEYDPSV
jgi:hypothetical protein